MSRLNITESKKASPAASPVLKRGRRCRGMALVAIMLVLFVTLCLLLVGQIGPMATADRNGVMTVTTNSVQSSGARMNQTIAFNMAQSGIDVAINWLQNQSQAPTNTSAWAPALPGSTTAGSPARAQVIPNSALPTSYFTVEIYPDVSNPSNTQKKYMIESVGYGAGQSQIVDAYVENSSLSKYEVLLNSWAPANNYWVQGLTTFDGPVHDNNVGGQDENVLWLNPPDGAPPLFLYTGSDAYSVSGSGINWYLNNWWSSQAPESESDWACVAAGGSSSVHTGEASVTFPTASTLQMNAALGSASAPSTTGVMIPNSGGAATAGIYIHGNVNTMQLGVGSLSSTQMIMVNQTDPSTSDTIQTYITINPTNNTTSLTVITTPPHGSATTVTKQYVGTTNEVVYCDGNIGAGAAESGTCAGGLYGVVADNVVNSSGQITQRNSLTIAVNEQTSDINLAGNMKYNTERAMSNGSYVPESQDSNFTEHAGVLGLVADNIMLDQNDYNGNPLKNFEFDGAEFANGICDADNWAGRPVGTWENMGSYLSSIVGVFGQFDSNNNLVNGFNTNFNYDQRLRDTPPPYYPSTSNQYDIISWQRAASTLQ